MDFFLDFHDLPHVREGIEEGVTWILIAGALVVGTGNLKGNHIKGVYVLPRYKGKGYGTMIMDRIKGEIPVEHGVAVIDLSLTSSAFYESRG